MQACFRGRNLQGLFSDTCNKFCRYVFVVVCGAYEGLKHGGHTDSREVPSPEACDDNYTLLPLLLTTFGHEPCPSVPSPRLPLNLPKFLAPAPPTPILLALVSPAASNDADVVTIHVVSSAFSLSLSLLLLLLLLLFCVSPTSFSTCLCEASARCLVVLVHIGWLVDWFTGLLVAVHIPELQYING